VARHAEFVRIAGDPVEYAHRILADSRHSQPEAGRDPEWDARTHYVGGEDEVIAYVFTLDAVNFGSGYFPHLLKRPGLSGYFTVALSLKERFDREGPFTAGELQRLDRDGTSRLFGQDHGDPLRDELMHLFAQALRDLGSFLEEGFGGSFRRLLDAAEGSAERLAEILTTMPFFRDVATYRGRQVALLKRAQITPSDLALALAGKPAGRFEDLDRLTIFADNLVPHVLRLDGVLEYAPSLVSRLDRGQPLAPGSAEEVEIRAVALHAVERMVAGLRAEGQRVGARRLDLLLWNRGQAERYRGGSKHRTRTVFY
jgi:hypothetical protein